VCGAGVAELSYQLPPRIPGNHLVYHGTRLVVVSRRLGKELHIGVPPDCIDLPRYLEFFRDLATRDYRPLSGIRVETVNEAPVRDSVYADALVAFGFLRDYRAYTLPSTYR
jgi:ATP-dependent Lhr-like helicase